MPAKNPSELPLLMITRRRFINVVEDLITRGVVKHEKEFLELSGVTNSILTKLKKESAFVTAGMINKVCKKFNVDPRYLVYPFQQQMYLPTKKRIAEIKSQIRDLQELLKEMEH